MPKNTKASGAAKEASSEKQKKAKPAPKKEHEKKKKKPKSEDSVKAAPKKKTEAPKKAAEPKKAAAEAAPKKHKKHKPKEKKEEKKEAKHAPKEEKQKEAKHAPKEEKHEHHEHQPKPKSVVAQMEAEDRMSDAEQKKFHKIFAKFDKDKSGTIDAKELDAVLDRLGVPVGKGNSALILQLLDVDGSKQLQRAPFEAFCARTLRRKAAYMKAKEMGKGAIGKSQLTRLLKQDGYAFTSAQVDKLVSRLGSGSEVTLADYVTIGAFFRFASVQFLLADTDMAGSLSTKKLASSLTRLGLVSGDASKFFKKYDVNDDGKLNREEFMVLVASELLSKR